MKEYQAVFETTIGDQYYSTPRTSLKAALNASMSEEDKERAGAVAIAKIGIRVREVTEYKSVPLNEIFEVQGTRGV